MKKVCEICGNCVKTTSILLPYADNLKTKKMYLMFECCGYIKQADFLSKNEISNLYTSEYSCFRKSNINNIVNNLLISLRVNKYIKLINNKDILEIGCGMGDFLLSAAKKSPKSIEGVEISNYASNNISKTNRNIKISNCDIESFISNKKFDSIFMFHSIEHVKDPVHLIARCSKMLKQGGCLVLETPNLFSWDRLIFKDKWFNYSVPHHTYIFSKKSLSEIGKNNSFVTLNTRDIRFPNTLTSQFANCPKLAYVMIWPIYIFEHFISSIFRSSSILSIVLQKQ